jgi:DNA-binding NtrC family response regulator
MSGLALRPVVRDRALVVADDPAERRELCGDLSDAGYDPVAFESCDGAMAWLDEETPAVAVVRTDGDRLCASLLDELEARGAEMVVDGEPVEYSPAFVGTAQARL